MITERMVILVGRAPNISWSASWNHHVFLTTLELQRFATSAERMNTGPDSILNIRLLVI